MSATHSLTVTQSDWQLTLAYGAGPSLASSINAATQKATPVAADRFGITDSAASFAFKYTTLQNVYDVLASYTLTFTNKTLTSPTINGGTIATATLTSPTISGATLTTSTLTSPTINGAKSPTTSVTATTHTHAVTENMLLVDDDTAGAIVTVNLIAAATAGDGYELTIKKLGTTANVVIDGNGSETIDGELTATLTTQYESITIKTNGTNWFIK